MCAVFPMEQMNDANVYYMIQPIWYMETMETTNKVNRKGVPLLPTIQNNKQVW